MTGQLQRIGQDFLPVVIDDHFLITPQGLQVRGKPSYDDCDTFWRKLRSLEKGVQFAIGDAAKYFRQRFGDKADQILSEATGLSFETLRAYEWTADKVPPETRHMETLTYSHHQAVGKLPPVEQAKWLDKAAQGDGDKPWSVSALKAKLKAADATEVSYWLVVRCKSEDDRTTLQKELESRGFTTSERGA